MCTKLQLDNILKDIYNMAVSTFGDSLDSVILFGSYARGDYDAESDIDIMIKLKMDKYEIVRYRGLISNYASRLGLENNILISIHLQDVKTFDYGKDVLPFYKNVLAEGVILSE